MYLVELANFSRRNIILVVSLQILSVSSDILRPRGVSLSRASLYVSDKDFVCLDGSLTIPFGQLNDDYCDCLDGSDEPGTSACPNGSFYCSNSGHKPINIPSSRVNDGICDCCDASDEYTTNAKCPNDCYELGQAARLEQQRLAEISKIGSVLRLEYSQKGLQLKQDKKEQLVKLQKHKGEAEVVQKEKEMLKQQAEELESSALEKYKFIEEQERLEREKKEAAKNEAEAANAFKRFDSNEDGFLEVAELQAREVFDKDRNGEVSAEEAKFFLNEQDSIDFERFVSDAWPLIKPFMLRESGVFKPPSENPPESEEDLQTGETDPEGQEELTDDDDEEETDLPEAEPEHEEEPTSKYDEETQRLVDAANAARKDYEAASQDVKDIQTEVNNIEDYLEKDYGADEELAVLHGQCFEYSDYEYIYKLCPFDKTIQQQKSGTSETRLGTWSRWAGPDGNKYSIMMYDNGQHCWNGPARSTKVQVACGSENMIVGVSEPNKCEYEFEFETPAVCREIVGDGLNDFHDEL